VTENVQTENPKLVRRHALERGLARVRWFGALFAFFQILTGTDPPCPPGAELRTLTNPITQYTPGCEPDWARPAGYALALGLVVVNVAVLLLLRRARDEKSLGRLGVGAFLADHLLVIAYTWLYSYTLETSIWVLLYILPLEGALRYGMRGALTSLAILTGTETGRDVFRQQAWGYPFHFVPDTTFRVGIMTIIGLVTGMMARNLDRERQEVEKKAIEASDLAAKEASARREVEAFHQATIAGVSTGDLQEALQRMISTVGDMFGYESLSMALLEDDEEPRLRVTAGYGYPEEAIGRTFTFEQGVSGPVAQTGSPALVNDVRAHEGYLDWAPWCRSEMVVPLKIGNRIIGVLNVESPREAAFTEDDLGVLEKLSLPLAVVVENARILATEKEAVRRLTELDEMKSDFIAITSHELRTPLTSIMGFLKTVRREGLDLSDTDRENYLDIVERQSQRLLEIVEDLLFASRIEQGAVEFRRALFDLGALLKEVVEDRFADHARQIRLATPAQAIFVPSDRDRVRRVIFSLVDNALKFSHPEGEVTISLGADNGGAKLDITDRGIGIPREEIGRIFDRFHQVGGSMGRAQPGFGLGLYVCKRIIDSLGGTINVKSDSGKGSTFSVTLPLSESDSSTRAAS
jgi:signal transduction histidine kinase